MEAHGRQRRSAVGYEASSHVDYWSGDRKLTMSEP